MKTSLIALAAALGIAFALPAAASAQDRHAFTAAGKLDSGKRKPSTAVRESPEVRGGTLDDGTVIFFERCVSAVTVRVRPAWQGPLR